MKDWIVASMLASVAVFAPIQGVLVTVGVLIFADAITGMIAAHKRKEKIDSAGMRRTITKMLVYQTAVLTGFLFEFFLIGGLLPIAKLVAAAIGAVELKSILENVTEVTGANFSSIIKKLGSDNDKKD